MTAATKQERREAYAEKIETKRERFAERAERASEKSSEAFESSRRIGSMIPMGQPILVGHHSERRHRRDIARIDRKMGEAIREGEKAASYAGKAESYGTHGISSDNPDAIDLLRAKLQGLEAERDALKAANKVLAAAHRKAKKANGGADIIGGDKWTEIVNGLDVSEDARAAMLSNFRYHCQDRCSYHSVKFGYSITNLGGNIRTVKGRIKVLEREEERAESGAAVEVQGEGYTLKECHEDNRIRFVFDGKPSEEVRKILKGNGWRWARSVGAWQRQLTDNGRASAQYVRSQISKL